MVGLGSGGWVEGAQDENLMAAHQAIGEGVLPLRKLFKDCFERNQVSLYHTHGHKHNCQLRRAQPGRGLHGVRAHTQLKGATALWQPTRNTSIPH